MSTIVTRAGKGSALTWTEADANITNLNTDKMESFTVAGDSGTSQTVAGGNTLTIAGGTGLTSVASATDVITLNLDNTAVTAAAYTNANITIDAQGRITAAANGFNPASPGAIGATTESTGRFTTVTSTATTGAGLAVSSTSASAVSLSGNAIWTQGGIGASSLRINGQIVSVAATGTAPFVVASTTNVANLNASSLNGATFASPGDIGGTTAASGTFTSINFKNPIEPVYSLGTTGGTIAPDPANGSVQSITLNSALTINAFTNPTAGESLTLIINGGTAYTSITSTMKFAGGVKTLTGTAGCVDILSVFYDGTTYYASLGKGYA